MSDRRPSDDKIDSVGTGSRGPSYDSMGCLAEVGLGKENRAASIILMVRSEKLITLGTGRFDKDVASSIVVSVRLSAPRSRCISSA